MKWILSGSSASTLLPEITAIVVVGETAYLGTANPSKKERKERRRRRGKREFVEGFMEAPPRRKKLVAAEGGILRSDGSTNKIYFLSKKRNEPTKNKPNPPERRGCQKDVSEALT